MLMKKVITLLYIAVLLLAPASASGQSLSNLLKGLGSSSSSSSSSDSGSSLTDLISGVAGALGFGNSGASIESLAGTWTYKAPAVAFKSDNLLLKAGGAAAASNIEAKLAPYYKTAGIDQLVLTINADSTFTFKTRTTLSGTITHDEESGLYVFHFQALKKINIGSMETYIQLSGSNMELTFDVSKLMTILQKVSAITNNSTLKGASALLEQYDGLTAGFELTRSSDTASTSTVDATTGATSKN